MVASAKLLPANKAERGAARVWRGTKKGASNTAARVTLKTRRKNQENEKRDKAIAAVALVLSGNFRIDEIDRAHVAARMLRSDAQGGPPTPPPEPGGDADAERVTVDGAGTALEEQEARKATQAILSPAWRPRRWRDHLDEYLRVSADEGLAGEDSSTWSMVVPNGNTRAWAVEVGLLCAR